MGRAADQFRKDLARAEDMRRAEKYRDEPAEYPDMSHLKFGTIDLGIDPGCCVHCGADLDRGDTCPRCRDRMIEAGEW